MAKIIARHLAIDMYKCKAKQFENSGAPAEDVAELFKSNGLEVISTNFQIINPGHKMIMLTFAEGHCSIHLFNALNYAAVDFFLCEPAATPEKLFSSLRNLFDPDKVKTTSLNRGDFGTVPDMKPTIKTRIAPLHRIHNTGARVIRLLAHRPSLHEKF